MSKFMIFVGDMTQEQANGLGLAIQDVKDRLIEKMKTGRCSFGLLVDLAKHVVMNTLDVDGVYDEIANLENPESRITGTKGVQKFKHAPLAGLSYKHYYCATSLLQNLQNELQYGKTVEIFLMDKMGQTITTQSLNELTHEIVVKNFERRSIDRRLTGEWLIFDESESGNYYLTLGGHAEGDDIIHSRVMHYRSVDSEIARNAGHPDSESG
jgi:hypothetical protein